MKTTIGADPNTIFGLLTTLLERLWAAYRKNDKTFLLQLEKFLKFSSKKRSEITGVKDVVEETPHLKVSSYDVAVEPSSSIFNPQKHFKDGKVKYWLGDNFKKHVLDPTEPFSQNEVMPFAKHFLKIDTSDQDIMSELGISENSGKLMTREEILWTIACLTEKQPNGEPGELLTNGYVTIIGYMKCDDGVVRAVRVRWSSGIRGWYCPCSELDRWNAGCEVLSRN